MYINIYIYIYRVMWPKANSMKQCPLSGMPTNYKLINSPKAISSTWET